MTRLLALAAALLLATPAGAYWDYGHRTIARIAMANVTPRTRAAVKRILATSALLDTPECRAKTPEDAAVWADCVKSLKDANGKPRFGYAYGWHFQDVEICRPYDPLPACKDGNCVSARIDRDVALLRDPATAPAERVMSLAFLLHFVGDLHQPLHAGEKGDKGGNDVSVSYGVYAPPKLNLHSVWDGLLAERAITSGRWRRAMSPTGAASRGRSRTTPCTRAHSATRARRPRRTSRSRKRRSRLGSRPPGWKSSAAG